MRQNSRAMMETKTVAVHVPGCGSRGFSLIELMFVVVILGILAAAVGINMGSTKTTLKNCVYATKLQFNLAKLEATKRNRNVYVDFDFLPVYGDVDNGYTVWVDENDNGAYDSGVDTVIGSTVVFDNISNPDFGRQGPEIYCGTCSISGGPANIAGVGGTHIDDGVTASGNRFRFRPNGMSSSGAVYLYFPEGSVGSKSVVHGPWVVYVNNVGRIRVDEWNSVNGWSIQND